jgi:hypothetical protein
MSPRSLQDIANELEHLEKAYQSGLAYNELMKRTFTTSMQSSFGICCQLGISHQMKDEHAGRAAALRWAIEEFDAYYFTNRERLESELEQLRAQIAAEGFKDGGAGERPDPEHPEAEEDQEYFDGRWE